MGQIQGQYEVVSNAKLSDRFLCLCLDAPDIVNAACPGQFVHIRVMDGFEPFFRRPFSIYRCKQYVEIFYEIVGMGTQEMAKFKRGQKVDVIGPVGSCFKMPAKDITQVVMVAGGIGVAPFLFLSDMLYKRFPNVKMKLLYGGRTSGHVYRMQEFKDNGVMVCITTDDGSVGIKGRVSQLFSDIDLEQATQIYTCGPRPMMRSVQEFTKDHNICAEAACEEVMACALGACLGCAIETTQGYKTVCYEGPVFDLQEIIF